jgi:pyruvate,orthophosphate dikinase
MREWEAGAAIDIIAFDEPLPAGVDAAALLGGKGAGLAEMTQKLGLPVPPGFTITTAVCRRYLTSGWPDGLDRQLEAKLTKLAEQTGRRFGDPKAPLLVSVRSGAPVSMPGMMDTLLNVGITPPIRERLAEESGSAVFAADTWLRFCRMYAAIVLGLPEETIAAAAAHDGGAAALLAAAERVRALAAEQAAPGIPDAPRAQLRGAIEAVFRSWDAERARVFRAREHVSDDLGTAATVQAMVFGNLDGRSGTGVAFTRNPASGDPQPYGDYLPRAQGEDVVAGTHDVSGLDALRAQLPEVYDELIAVLRRLERHYRDLCDVEFTVSAGRLYVLQTRIGRRSPLAAARIAVAMAEDPDFPLSRAEAVARVEPDTLHQLANSVQIVPGAEPLASGLPASPGVGAGPLCCDPDRAAELGAAGQPVVLAREETSPADVHGMVRAAAIVTATGGVASHGAAVARGGAIPAVTSLRGAAIDADGIHLGETLIEPGTWLTVDGGTGQVYLGDRRAAATEEIEEVRTLRRWRAELEGGADWAVSPGGSRLVPFALLDLARVVQLKGLCTPATAAATLAAEEAAVQRLFAEHEALFRSTPRGVALSPAGRDWLQEQLAAERAALDSAALNAAYERFMQLNLRFKRLVTDWQLATANGHTPEALAALAEALAALHAEVRPLVQETAVQLPRLARYAERFDAALARLRAGDASMLASPLKDSYHTIWFEYHEELIALCGRDRAAEERAEDS